ncbi:mitogen-activated protein kinase kinase kinase 3 isoform X2 [Malania oleifera]|uniref:mitogen-activated protein kinase kinase kinase 3 isoform X2 n=1 Tax=Malania oleifera TaxID=397392 RepID=UPI0025ADCDC9|nr:mitogen-activated protein kinase kinase kinase 3 isoform X2 [Malania oleifera]
MPAWWGRKSSKNKQQQQQHPERAKINFSEAAIEDNKKKTKEKPKSLDQVSGTLLTRNSPRNSREFAAANGVGRLSSAFSGFDSDGGDKTPLPLPRPLISSTPSPANDHVVGLGSGSVSVSSVSSSGSSSDDPLPHEHAQLGLYRGHSEMKLNSRPRSPCHGSRGATATTSPLHPRLGVSSLETSMGKQEDGKSQCHRLPLPPSSPTSPTALPSSRGSGVAENANYTLSKWKKGRLLGRGTFGHVYLGFNSENGQMCAIKEVRVVSDDQTSKECLKQLNQEITLLSQLSHPNIVQYYGSELGEEALSVYLEYVSGGSIHKLLQEYGPFKEPVIQNYTRQIISGLAYLHGRNTVHRDIKGANILVDPNGEIKLADFGMAKHITACSSMLSFKGSPYWMAPEVVMNTNGYSLTVDIWSLGCTILEMATSKPPWSQYEGPASEVHSNRTSMASSDGDYMTKPVVTVSRAMKTSRETVRTITSLPVSPCSSPLRRSGPAYNTFLLSPPPSYGFSGYNPNECSSYPMRQNAKCTFDPWPEIPLGKNQTPGGSPRTRTYN